MNSRQNIPEQLSAYLDGELSPQEVAALERKLASDPALASELRRLQAVRRLVRQLPREKAGDDFVSRVLERAERIHLVAEPLAGSEQGVLRWARHLATAAMVLLAAGIVGVIILTVSKTPNMSRFQPQARQSPSNETTKDGRKLDNSDGTLAMGPKDDLRYYKGGGQLSGGDLDGYYTDRGTRPAVLAFNFVIQTPNLERTQRSLENVLDRSQSPVMSKAGPGRQYDVRQGGDETVQYRLRMTMAQAQQLQKDVEQLRLHGDFGYKIPVASGKPAGPQDSPGGIAGESDSKKFEGDAVAAKEGKDEAGRDRVAVKEDKHKESYSENWLSALFKRREFAAAEAPAATAAASVPPATTAPAPAEAVPPALEPVAMAPGAPAPASAPASRTPGKMGRGPTTLAASAPAEVQATPKTSDDLKKELSPAPKVALPAPAKPDTPVAAKPSSQSELTDQAKPDAEKNTAAGVAREQDDARIYFDKTASTSPAQNLAKDQSRPYAASQPAYEYQQAAQSSLSADEVEVVITLQKVSVTAADVSATTQPKAASPSGGTSGN